MSYYSKIFKESIIIIILTSIIGTFSGTLLSSNEEILYAFPILLLILPSLNSLIGDISSILISRLTSHLYIGTISSKLEKSDRLMKDFSGLLITLLLSLGFLIGSGYLLGSICSIEIINPFLIVFILFITTLTLFIIIFLFSFVSSIFLFKRGKDPNNFLIPLATSMIDFLTPLFIILFTILFI